MHINNKMIVQKVQNKGLTIAIIGVLVVQTMKNYENY